MLLGFRRPQAPQRYRSDASAVWRLVVHVCPLRASVVPGRGVAEHLIDRVGVRVEALDVHYQLLRPGLSWRLAVPHLAHADAERDVASYAPNPCHC